jgi:hypothetical protein
VDGTMVLDQCGCTIVLNTPGGGSFHEDKYSTQMRIEVS